MKKPPAPELCRHEGSREIRTLSGHVSRRVSDGKPIRYCPDCKSVGADVLPKTKD